MFSQECLTEEIVHQTMVSDLMLEILLLCFVLFFMSPPTSSSNTQPGGNNTLWCQPWDRSLVEEPFKACTPGSSY